MTSRCPVEAHLAHLELREMSPRTIAARRAHLIRLARFLGVDLGEELLLADEGDLARWQQSMLGKSPNYRISSTAHIREFYRFAVKQRFIVEDPARNLITPRQPVRVPHPIDTLDLDTAIQFAPAKIRAMLVLAAYCGLRAVEISRLTREQIRDDVAQPVLVVIGKGNRQRVIPLPAMVLEELRRYGLPMAGPVFLRGDGLACAVSPQRVSQVCNVHLHALGIAESLHKLRHYYGTQMYAASKDLVMVSTVMGHSSTTTTSGYVAYDRQAAQAAGAAVAADSQLRGPVRARLRAVPDGALDGLSVKNDMGGPVGKGNLTARERDVLLLMVQGLSNPDIGQELGLSAHTIDTHVAGILRKTGAATRAGAAVVALRTGLVA